MSNNNFNLRKSESDPNQDIMDGEYNYYTNDPLGGEDLPANAGLADGGNADQIKISFSKRLFMDIGMAAYFSICGYIGSKIVFGGIYGAIFYYIEEHGTQTLWQMICEYAFGWDLLTHSLISAGVSLLIFICTLIFLFGANIKYKFNVSSNDDPPGTVVISIMGGIGTAAAIFFGAYLWGVIIALISFILAVAVNNIQSKEKGTLV
ncbi:MAG: hypothetical protein Q4G69_06735 [Planctomycetia bacterium]|nr:hypothetical protein [Planctomycetia bacterium]